jgi:hypothetical protein
MSHMVAPAGVHYFRVAPPPRQWLALTELAEAVFADGFTTAEDGAQQPTAALLSAAHESHTRIVRVAQGEASAMQSTEPFAFASVTQAVGWLLS